MVAHALTLPGANVLPAPIPVATLELKLNRRPHSPLFARLASDYLAAGRVADARSLLASGIELYPRYATGHIVFAQCQALAGDLSGALAAIERARVILPEADNLREMAVKWETALKARPSIEARPGSIVTDAVIAEARPDGIAADAAVVEPEVTVHEASWTEVAEPVVEERVIPEVRAVEAPAEPAEVAPEIPPPAEPVAARVEIPAGEPAAPPEAPPEVKLSPAAIPQIDPVAAAEAASQRLAAAMSALPPLAPAEAADESAAMPLDDDGRIVSGTLAEIYAKQGAFGEAIITYRLLKRQKPGRAAECDARIVELEKLRAERRPATSAR